MGKTFAELYQSPPEFPKKEIEIPELGGTFYITTMRGDKHRELLHEQEEQIKDATKDSEYAYWALSLSKTLVDVEGNYPTFAFMISLPGTFLRKYGKMAMEFNSLDDQSQADIEKKSDPQEPADSLN
jgi:hypothetical protein